MMKFHRIRKATDDSIINDPQVIAFCRSHFSSNEESRKFIKRALRKNQTRWMFNRVRWFIEVADEQRHDSLKVLFLLAMAETNIKFMENRYEDFRDSGPDVKKFWP